MTSSHSLTPSEAGDDAGVMRAGATSGAAPDYAAIRRALMKAVGSACPGWLANQREDIVQVAMTKVVRLVEDGKTADELGAAYLGRLGYCAVIDEVRRQRRRRAMAVVEENVDERVATEAPGPEARAHGRRLGQAIRDCMSALARSRRIAVGLYLEGRGATEISRMLGWKRKQADNLVYRGLADVRQCLQKKGVEP